MRYAIISDVHANIDALVTVLDKIDSMSIDQVVCLGDVVGYNAAPNECSRILRERGIPTIMGNHDAVSSGIEEPWGFNPVALAAVMWTREKLNEENTDWLKSLPDALNFGYFVAVHGAPKNHNAYLFSWEDILPHLYFLEEQNVNICLIGHTHNPGIFSADGVYTVDSDSKFSLGTDKSFFINPGSVGQPRDSDPRSSFGIVDTEENTYEQVRVAYAIDRAAKRIIEGGLPAFLAERLSIGR